VAGLLYLDASAIVKLVVDEAETAALRDALRGRPARVSSALALVEVRLAAARRTPRPLPRRVDTILAGLTLIPIDHATLEGAARLGPPYGVRALDAIHLATARSLGRDLEALVAYDQRLLAAAEASGLRTEQPR
jgi:predicted nucleic acid-binding protein